MGTNEAEVDAKPEVSSAIPGGEGGIRISFAYFLERIFKNFLFFCLPLKMCLEEVYKVKWVLNLE